MMQSSQMSSSVKFRGINPLVRVGSVLFAVWGVLHVWVGVEGFRQYLNGVHAQWEMLIVVLMPLVQSFNMHSALTSRSLALVS